MAEEVIVAGAGDIIGRLISLASEEIGLLCGVHQEVKKLGRVLTKNQAVLCEAEKRQVGNETVKLWLKDLKDMAYDAEDILDEIAYKDLRYKVEIQNSKKKKVRNFCSLSHNPIALRSKIGHQIRDFNKKLDDIKKEKDMFQLVLEPPNQNENAGMDRETSSFVDDSAVVGREDDKSQIVQMLIHGSSHQESSGTLSVVPIVGLGGLGKTTLAQLVYNDEDVGKHFDLRIWVCASVDFVIAGLWTQILKQITTGTRESPSKQELQNNLLKQLSGKKFLLVVDDVWDEDPDKWDDLILPLKSGSAGSKIIVTTRSKMVASVVGTVPTYDLQVLSEDICWDLFERRAFKAGGPEKTSTLEIIGREIVKKCGGVPLAVKSLGGLMHSKRQQRQWFAVQNSEIWNISDQHNKIIEVLRLSYDDLPPQLKQCFSYCAIFPKDWWIEKEILIQLWMAQGLLGTSMMEDTGNEYFNILHSKSFFQDASKNEFGDIIGCKMHDLVHDLAKSITKLECQIVVANENQEVLSRCRHATLISNRNMPTVLEDLYKAKQLRTVYFSKIEFHPEPQGVRYDGFFNLRLLRVLDLSGTSISEFPSSISKLKHLRYLDLSCTQIESLPKCVTRLYHMQTLKLYSCYNLKVLPEDLRNLISLRHLYIDPFREWKMPRAIGQLRLLQTLPVFKVGEEDDGRGIAQLECLNHLGGGLRIYYLDQVKDLMSAKRANLMGKRNMQDLELEWNADESRYEHHVSVLEGLQPHPNLKKLTICHFGGFRFPRWVTSGSALPSLVNINLNICNKCEHISSFKELPKLEVLEIRCMSSVKHFGGSWDDSGTGVAPIIEKEEGGEDGVESKASYPSLKQLTLHSMPNLEEWSENVGFNFPCLKELHVSDCPNLRKTPHLFPSLKKLDLLEVGGMGVRSITSSLTSLTFLTIGGSEDLTFLTEGLLRKNKDLKHLQIAKVPKIPSLIPSFSSR